VGPQRVLGFTQRGTRLVGQRGGVGLAAMNGADGEPARPDRAPACGEARLPRLVGGVELAPERVGETRELVAAVGSFGD
jgi:hypothetical protein